MAQDDNLKEQVKNIEAKSKVIIDNTIRIPLTEKQASIIRKVAMDKQVLEKEFNKLNEKESELITLALEFKAIDQKKVEQVKFSELGDALVVIMKPEEKLKVKEEKVLDPKQDIIGDNIIVGDNNLQINK